MQNLLTQPAGTNTVLVPSFDALQDGGGSFVREAIAKLCFAAMSPSQPWGKAAEATACIVSSLWARSSANNAQTLDEAFVAKARKFLNGLVGRLVSNSTTRLLRPRSLRPETGARGSRSRILRGGALKSLITSGRRQRPARASRRWVSEPPECRVAP